MDLASGELPLKALSDQAFDEILRTLSQLGQSPRRGVVRNTIVALADLIASAPGAERRGQAVEALIDASLAPAVAGDADTATIAAAAIAKLERGSRAAAIGSLRARASASRDLAVAERAFQVASLVIRHRSDAGTSISADLQAYRTLLGLKATSAGARARQNLVPSAIIALIAIVLLYSLAKTLSTTVLVEVEDLSALLTGAFGAALLASLVAASFSISDRLLTNHLSRALEALLLALLIAIATIPIYWAIQILLAFFEPSASDAGARARGLSSFSSFSSSRAFTPWTNEPTMVWRIIPALAGGVFVARAATLWLPLGTSHWCRIGRAVAAALIALAVVFLIAANRDSILVGQRWLEAGVIAAAAAAGAAWVSVRPLAVGDGASDVRWSTRLGLAALAVGAILALAWPTGDFLRAAQQERLDTSPIDKARRLKPNCTSPNGRVFNGLLLGHFYPVEACAGKDVVIETKYKVAAAKSATQPSDDLKLASKPSVEINDKRAIDALDAVLAESGRDLVMLFFDGGLNRVDVKDDPEPPAYGLKWGSRYQQEGVYLCVDDGRIMRNFCGSKRSLSYSQLSNALTIALFHPGRIGQALTADANSSFFDIEEEDDPETLINTKRQKALEAESGFSVTVKAVDPVVRAARGARASRLGNRIIP